MNVQNVIDRLTKDFPDHIFDKYPIPLPFIGTDKIKAIVLGADPTHIINSEPKCLNMVFGLDMDYSPYCNGIGKNLERIRGLSLNNVYVQNIVGTQPDMIEFVSSLAAAWDCPVSLSGSLHSYKTHARTSDNFEVYRR